MLKKKLEKKLNLVKIIQQKLQVEETEGVNRVASELSEILVRILGEKINSKSPYKKILRELESNLAEVIMNDTNENIKKVLSSLIKPEFLNPIKFSISKQDISFGSRDTTRIYQSKFLELEFAPRFTELLKINGYEHFKNKNVSKIRFDKNIVKYLRTFNIKLTYYFVKPVLDDELKNQLVKVSKNKSKRGALAINYKLLINIFWNMQNKIELKKISFKILSLG